jgi:hypothetical protein
MRPDTTSWMKEKDWVNARKTAREAVWRYIPEAYRLAEMLAGNNRWDEAAVVLSELSMDFQNVAVSARKAM